MSQEGLQECNFSFLVKVSYSICSVQMQSLWVIVNKLHRKKVVGRWSADHLLTDHLPTIYRPLTDHLLTTYRPLTDHLPTTYRPLTHHLPTTFFTVQLVHDYCHCVHAFLNNQNHQPLFFHFSTIQTPRRTEYSSSHACAWM